jgi:formiminoglutamate deiminase
MRKLWFERALLPQGWTHDVLMGVDDGRIATLAIGASRADADEHHGAAIPGLCNVHSHGFQRGMAGLSERRGQSGDDFWSWREIMYRFLDRLTPDDIAAITAQAYVEMLETGYTRVGEFHYLHNDVDGNRYADPAETAGSIVEAATITGIGLTLLPVFYAHGDFGGAAPSAGQRRFLSDVDSFVRLMETSRAKLPADASIGVAPHSLRAVTPEELAAILPSAQGGPIHIHAAEQVREVESCVGWSGARPVEWLLDNAAVDARWCLIHATHLDDRECDRLAASGAVAGLCPVTEGNLGDGTFPGVRYLAAGGRFGTGTDSNILIDPAGEMRAFEYSQRLLRRQRALLAGEDMPSVGLTLFTRSLAGGAQALGQDTGFVPGTPADILTFDMTHPALAAADDVTLLDRWIFAGRAGLIDTVWRGGAKCVTGGMHVAREAVARRYRTTLEKLLS